MFKPSTIRTLLLFLALLALPAGAQATETASPADIYAVSGIKVDATADSAVKARDSALAEGAIKGFEQLLDRIVPADKRAQLSKMDLAQINALVADFMVETERSSGTRYLATLTYRFKPDRVRTLLRNNGITYSETTARPVLVLAVYEGQGTPQLFEPDNPWAKAWADRPVKGRLLPWVLPRGDALDRATISPAQAIAGEAGAIAQMAQRYGADATLIARATFARPLAPTDPGMPVGVGGTYYTAGGVRTATVTVKPQGAETADAVLARAVDGIMSGFEEEWKKETQLDSSQEGRLRVLVAAGNVGEWAGVRERLKGVAAVKKVEVESLSARGGALQITYLGTPERLTQILARRNLSLSETEGEWRLSLVGTPMGASQP